MSFTPNPPIGTTLAEFSPGGGLQYPLDSGALNNNTPIASVSQVVLFSTSFPSGPATGQLVFRTDLNVVFTWTGSQWKVTGACGVGTSFPTSPAPIKGQFFYRSDTSMLYLYLAAWTAVGGSGVTQITGPGGVETGALTFTGAGVTNVGTTFTFSGGATTLLANFTPPAYGQTATANVASTAGMVVGQEWQVNYTDGSPPYVGLIQSITDATHVVVQTPYPTVVYNANNFDSAIIGGNFASIPTNYYEMNESSGTTVVDAMGANNGTYSGTFAFQRAQLVADYKPAPFFNAGVPNYAVLHDPTTSATSFTLMTCFKSAGPPVSGVLLSNYTGGAAYVILYFDTNNNVNYQFNGGATILGSGNGGPHIVFQVFDGTSHYGYFDGALAYKNTSTYTKQASGFYAGQHPTGANPANAVIGKIGLWGSTALSASQIYNIAQQFLWNN